LRCDRNWLRTIPARRTVPATGPPDRPPTRHDLRVRWVREINDPEVAVLAGVEPLAERRGKERVDVGAALEQVELVDSASASVDPEVREVDRTRRIRHVPDVDAEHVVVERGVLEVAALDPRDEQVAGEA
jgi:hypothetical protein